MRVIGPDTLANFVGDRVAVNVHIGKGQYHAYRGVLMQGNGEDRPEFYVGKVQSKRVSLRPTDQLPITHGEWITLPNNGRGFHNIRHYVFVDDSD